LGDLVSLKENHIGGKEGKNKQLIPFNSLAL